MLQLLLQLLLQPLPQLQLQLQLLFVLYSRVLSYWMHVQANAVKIQEL